MLKVTIPNAHKLDEGVWRLTLPPHQVRLFGRCENAIGPRSVVIIKEAQHELSTGDLSFDVDEATAINVGSTPDTLAILSNENADELISGKTSSETEQEISVSRGDREFLELCRKEFHDPMQRVAAALLAGVRAKSPGELKRGLKRNFSETPDNFWYVIVQPRVQELSVTVRGPEEHFSGLTEIPVKDDRGNTRFKVSDESDIESALKLIFHAKRKL